MTEISHTALHEPHATIDRGLATFVEPRVRQDTGAMDWPRLRRIVDALLGRAAASKDDTPAIAAKTTVSISTSPAEQERIRG